jgi:hypothetical protein
VKTPENILKRLRQRKGFDENECWNDAELDRMSPMEKLREVAGWELGDPSWAGTFIQWAKDCGFEIK